MGINDSIVPPEGWHFTTRGRLVEGQEYAVVMDLRHTYKAGHSMTGSDLLLARDLPPTVNVTLDREVAMEFARHWGDREQGLLSGRIGKVIADALKLKGGN